MSPDSSPVSSVDSSLIPSVSSDKDLPSFNRAFWTLAIGVLVLHIFGIVLWINDDSGFSTLSYNSYVILYIWGFVWNVILVCIIGWGLESAGIPFRRIIHAPTAKLPDMLRTVLKYYLGILPVLLLLSLISSTSVFDSPEFNLTLIILFGLSTIVVAPICEEVLFRGYLYSAMLGHFKRRRERLVINAMLFSVAHITVLDFVLGASVPVYIFGIGFLLAYLYEKYRSIVPCIILHALNNGTVFVIEYFNLV